MTFKQAYEQTLRRWGRDPASWGGDAADQKEVADMLEWALEKAWRHTMWSRLLELSEETVETSEGKSYVPWTEEGRTVVAVWPQDPFKTHTGSLPYFMRGGEIVFPYGTKLANTVFVEYRPAPRLFTRVAYAPVVVYDTGDVVYDDATGDCYVSVQDSNTGNAVTDTDWWTAQTIPAWLNQYAVRRAYAELLRNDGQQDRANVEEARSEDLLEAMLLSEESQQRQHHQFRVSGR